MVQIAFSVQNDFASECGNQVDLDDEKYDEASLESQPTENEDTRVIHPREAASRAEKDCIKRQAAVLALEAKLSKKSKSKRAEHLQELATWDDPNKHMIYLAYLYAHPEDNPSGRRTSVEAYRRKRYRKDSDLVSCREAEGVTIREAHKELFPNLMQWDQPATQQPED